eukprot:GABW01004491.1.p1 GENE.GABW01004491.1~~GABW01004491.1.p1  ORF type:complete len:53 (-),score=12.49 GABW01004491.1:3-161(-)
MMDLVEEAYHYGVRNPSHRHLLQLGEGRYGQFKLQYAMPDDANCEGVTAHST